MFKRNCPECNNEISYTTKTGYNKSLKLNAKCKRCSKLGKNNPMFGKSGELNPFYGKTHCVESLDKMSKIKMGKTHTEEWIKNASEISSGENNPMYGKTVYEVWVEKYGEDIAKEKLVELKLKMSNSKRGEKNNMFGKPSPIGSGNGWSGWYKGWYFRSMLELTYMIKVIERFNLKWESGETKKYRINYLDHQGNMKNYFPDFVIEKKYMVEIKPKRLWNTVSVVSKKKSAEEFCKNKNLIYKITEAKKITINELIEIYNSGVIKFIKKYEVKYQKLLKTKNI